MVAARKIPLWLRASLLTAASVAVSLTVIQAPAEANGCAGSSVSDFNGDGVTDVVIADPGAVVSGKQSAGVVHVVDGASGGVVTVSADDVPGLSSEADAQFGFATAVYDADKDGCDDLVVSSPFATVSGQARAGLVAVIHGSSLGVSPSTGVVWHQDSVGVPGGAEPGDEFGYSLAAGHTHDGKPYLVVGVPGDDVGTIANAGMVNYIRDDVKLIFHQDSAGIGGVAEVDDQFGFAVAASPNHVAVGYPGEAIGAEAGSGGVNVLTHDVSGATLEQVRILEQEDIDSGLDEAGDRFGAQLSMVAYVPPGGGSGGSMLAIGVPGEALGQEAQAGRVVATIALTSAGTITSVQSIHQDVTGVDDDAEEGDSFGWQVRLVNRDPGVPATWQNLLLAVGVPGEDRGAYLDNGGVQVFSLVGPPGDHDVWVDDAIDSAGFVASDYRLIGRSIGANAQHLLVADSLATPPAVYVVPWTALTGESMVTADVYISGQNGLPVGGSGKFGWSTA